MNRETPEVYFIQDHYGLVANYSEEIVRNFICMTYVGNKLYFLNMTLKQIKSTKF